MDATLQGRRHLAYITTDKIVGFGSVGMWWDVGTCLIDTRRRDDCLLEAAQIQGNKRGDENRSSLLTIRFHSTSADSARV